MKHVTAEDIKDLYISPPDSHKGQNGKLLLIGGSHLFHAASLWALEVASRIVDLVHYASIPENNEIVKKAKEQFRNGIVINRGDIEDYIEEDDVILIGPGMVRAEGSKIRNPKSETRNKSKIQNLNDLNKIKDEGIQTAVLTNYLLKKYPKKQWVIDAGALQMMDVDLIPKNAILTPHKGEFARLIANENFDVSSVSLPNKQEKASQSLRRSQSEETQNFIGSRSQLNSAVSQFAQRHRCTVLLKGKEDIVSDGKETKIVTGGNAGMTKGGTGDVLAGLVAALSCKNDPMLAAVAASFINKQAGDELYKSVGPYFNASDLADQIPWTMKDLFI